ncbi:WXG100 family type VII secretion target [Nocardia sp. GAS34]|uniref:WXG100 family type VII secretion target n=1 Tax=unclassified Nocardia TaxID=2637762 RepID=UPI003D23BEB7
MTEPFSVDLDQLDSLVTHLANLATFLTDRLDDLDRRAAAVHEGSWSGAAATAHETAHREWAVGAREFAEGVAAMREGLRRAHGHYSTAQSVNGSMLRGD